MTIALSTVVFTQADDTELFVATLPDSARPNVTLIMDDSGSMGWGSPTPMSQAQAAARNFLNNASDINISLMSFNGCNPGGNVDFASENIATARARAIGVINGYFADCGTPLGDTYYEAYRYYAGLSPRFGTGSVAASITGSNYRSPISNACQRNSIIVFTDGWPNTGEQSAAAINALTNGLTFPAGIGHLSHSCVADSGECMDEQAWFMFNNDVNANFRGDQQITTFTIGFGFTGTPPALLPRTANMGGGQFYTAANANQLSDVLNDILLRVNATANSFAAPAASTSSFNTLETSEDVYYVMFRPAAGPNWTGNLKRYRLGDDNQIYDVNNNLAIDPATGLFLDTAQSFWSSSADGLEVEEGGMAEQITSSRPAYTNTTGNSGVNLTETDNQLHENTAAITAAMLGAANATEREQLLQWGRGVDVDDADGDGSSTDNRTSVGDALHTQPRDITYFANATGTTVDKTVYFTTNDGFLHAVNAADGTTEFSFIPEDLLPNLKTYRDGFVTGGALKAYGLDGPMTVWHNDDNGDGDILQSNNGTADSNEHIYPYLTMRRGGNNIYALDVTNRSRPELKWVIRGDLDNNHQLDSRATNPDFNELGQTWSAPLLTRVNWNGSERQVLLFGAGYDVDTDTQTTTLSVSDIGSAIYMVDAETGAKLWRSSSRGYADLSVSGMNYAIAADLALVDIDQDGLLDFFYAADVGGQLFRFDIEPTNTGASNFATGGRIAQLSLQTAAESRRFFETPAVSIGRNSEYLNIAIGSGLRHTPLSTTVNDRMYVIRDPNVFDTPANYNYAVRGGSPSYIDESNLYDATSNLIQQGTNAQQQTALTSLESSNGWYIRMEGSGEKILSRASIFNGILLFSSFTPASGTTTNCTPGAGANNFYAVNVENASSVFNLDTSLAALNKSDRSQTLLSGTIAPAPSIVNRGNQGSEVCVGNQCFQNLLRSVRSIPMHRNFWRENR
ncbi:pilus assembly protein [Endozoicomonas lisbonensis]|uniref:pilus assembly protein n=1 Tax=Endozoicomonas lisbonensis TaxID=3120522 RepID=UPI0033944B07